MAAAVAAFFFPSVWLLRAIDGIVRHARFASDCRRELERAACAGALSTLARNRFWRPRVGEVVRLSFRSVHRQNMTIESQLDRDLVIMTIRKSDKLVPLGSGPKRRYQV